MHMAGQKIGFYSIRKYARLMCHFIQVFEPVIRKKYPANTALQAALTAAMAACNLLIQEIDEQAPVGV